jgi:hypothetical protein
MTLCSQSGIAQKQRPHHPFPQILFSGTNTIGPKIPAMILWCGMSMLQAQLAVLAEMSYLIRAEEEKVVELESCSKTGEKKSRARE